jgi:hypothetical protein
MLARSALRLYQQYAQERERLAWEQREHLKQQRPLDVGRTGRRNAPMYVPAASRSRYAPPGTPSARPTSERMLPAEDRPPCHPPQCPLRCRHWRRCFPLAGSLPSRTPVWAPLAGCWPASTGCGLSRSPSTSASCAGCWANNEVEKMDRCKRSTGASRHPPYVEGCSFLPRLPAFPPTLPMRE